MTRRLIDCGYEVTGIDASREMLAVARQKVGDDTLLVRADLPADDLPDLPRHDAAICCFDTANYFVADGALAAVLGQVARALRPDGLLMFDLNTRFKLEKVFGRYHSGDDFGDFAYVWRNRYDGRTHSCKIQLSFFVADGDVYRRSTETHVQRWFSDEEIDTALRQAGFTLVAISAAYSDAPVVETTTRVTVLATRTSGPA